MKSNREMTSLTTTAVKDLYKIEEKAYAARGSRTGVSL